MSGEVCQRCKHGAVTNTVTASGTSGVISVGLCRRCYDEWNGYRAQKQIEHHLRRFRASASWATGTGTTSSTVDWSAREGGA